MNDKLGARITGVSPLSGWLSRLAGSGTVRRRRRVWAEIAAVFALCYAGYTFLSESFRMAEVSLIVNSLHLLGVDNVAGMGTNIVLDSPDGLLVAVLTPTCSALLAILALLGLAGTVLRGRGWNTATGAVIAAGAIFMANAFRIGASVWIGTAVGKDALVLFHDWVGTVLNFVFVLGAFILMLWILLPGPARAEQDRHGVHTAYRPINWARPGLGYRSEISTMKSTDERPSIAAYLARALPRPIRQGLSMKRESQRVDYRVGDLNPVARAEALRELVSDGLEVHIATLWAAASYETDPYVLDALADAVAGRQWEPVVNDKVAGIRLWARAWSGRESRAGARPDGEGLRILVSGAGGPAGVAVIEQAKSLGYWVVGADADKDAVGFDLADSQVVLPAASKENYTQALVRACEDKAVDAVVLTTAEELQALAGREGELDKARVSSWIPQEEALANATDKAEFALIMEQAGIAHPPTSTSELVPGPWVIKARRGRGSKDVHYSNEAEHAQSLLTDGTRIIQTQVTGREWTCDILTSPQGQVLAAVPRWREATRGGISVKGRTFEDEGEISAVQDISIKALEAIGLRGVACAQGFINEDGKAVIIEVNPRFSGGLPLSIAAGADLVGAYIKLVLDRQEEVREMAWKRGVSMNRYFSEVFKDAQGRILPGPTGVSGEST